MKLWIKFFLLIVGIAAITGVASAVKRARDARNGSSNSSGSISGRPATNIFSSKANAEAATRDIHALRVLTPKDSEFNALLDRDYPSLVKIPGLQDLQSKMVLVQNQSSQPIHAFAIKWKLKSPGQAPTESFSSYMQIKTPGHFLPTAVVLAPNETRLLSPWFSLSKLQYANVQRTNAPADNLAAFLQLNITDAARDTRVLGTTVDGVVFGDTRFVGPDEYKLSDRFECERNGQHDESLSVFHAIQNGDSDEQIMERLKAHIQQRQTYASHADRQGFYMAARAAQAEVLLEMLKQDGRARVQQTTEDDVKRINRAALEK